MNSERDMSRGMTGGGMGWSCGFSFAHNEALYIDTRCEKAAKPKVCYHIL